MALSKYRTFEERLESLHIWPGQLLIEIQVVAQSGFCFHPFEGDEPDALRCAFCKCMLANWKRDTDPWQEHAVCSPFCVHLMACKGTEYIFKTIQREEVNNGTTAKDSFSRTFWTAMKKNLCAYGVKRIMDFRQQSSVTSKYNPVLTYTTLSGIQFTMPVHLDMTEFSARHDSLNRIPETSRRYLKLDEMAEAGLFYQDSVIKCYYCGHSFENCHQLADPWNLHVSQNYKCMHIVFMKGDDYIQMKLIESDGARRRSGADVNSVWKCKAGPDNEEAQLENVENSLKRLKVTDDNGDKIRRLSGCKGKAGKRRQRCDCLLQRRRETKIRQESVPWNSNNLLKRFVPQGNCSGPHMCYKCHLSGNTSGNNIVVSLCCNIIVCEGCVEGNECPKCRRSFVASEKMTME